MSLLHQMRARGQQFALDAVFLHAFAAQQRFALQRQLLFASFDVGFQRAMDGGALLRYALRLIARAVEQIKSFRKRARRFKAHSGVNLIGKCGYIRGSAAFIVYQRGRQRILRKERLRGGAYDMQIAFAGMRVRVSAGAIGDFARGLARQAADAIGEQLLHAAASPRHRRIERVRAHGIEGDFAVLRRAFVAQSRQHLAHGGNRFAHAARAVDDSALRIHEDQVGMLAHEFADERLVRAVAQIAQMLDFNFQYAVAVDLANIGNSPADQMLAHQHAQVKRLQRAGFLLHGDVRAGAADAG